MPWSPKQNKVWRAIEHGWNPPGDQFEGVTQEKASKMADEGVIGKDLDAHIGHTIKTMRRKHKIEKKMHTHSDRESRGK